jgi:MFS-type transporter involved in bile tolerance (Atg22 family)
VFSECFYKPSPYKYVNVISIAVFHDIMSAILLLNTQAESVTDAAWGCDWVGTPVPFQRCLVFIIATANKEFTLTAGKFVPVSNKTMMNVRITINNEE